MLTKIRESIEGVDRVKVVKRVIGIVILFFVFPTFALSINGTVTGFLDAIKFEFIAIGVILGIVGVSILLMWLFDGFEEDDDDDDDDYIY
jgi:uncharacterized membrane protein